MLNRLVILKKILRNSIMKNKILEHKKYHTKKHIEYMIKLIKQGKTFEKAHKLTMNKIGM